MWGFLAFFLSPLFGTSPSETVSTHGNPSITFDIFPSIYQYLPDQNERFKFYRDFCIINDKEKKALDVLDGYLNFLHVRPAFHKDTLEFHKRFFGSHPCLELALQMPPPSLVPHETVSKALKVIGKKIKGLEIGSIVRDEASEFPFHLTPHVRELVVWSLSVRAEREQNFFKGISQLVHLERVSFVASNILDRLNIVGSALASCKMLTVLDIFDLEMDRKVAESVWGNFFGQLGGLRNLSLTLSLGKGIITPWKVFPKSLESIKLQDNFRGSLELQTLPTHHEVIENCRALGQISNLVHLKLPTSLFRNRVTILASCLHYLTQVKILDLSSLYGGPDVCPPSHLRILFKSIVSMPNLENLVFNANQVYLYTDIFEEYFGRPNGRLKSITLEGNFVTIKNFTQILPIKV